MADTFSPLLRIRKQTTGANNNVWGALLNAAALQLVEDSIAGRVQKVVAGSDITLSVNNGANDEARMSTVSLTGAPGATKNIIIPNLAKWYIIENLTNAAQRIKTAAMDDADGVLVSVNDRKIVMCNGADGVFGVADTLGGLDASAFARRAERNSFSAGNANVPREFTDGSTITFDTTLANVWFGTLAGDRQVVFTNAADGSWLDIYFTQDSTGGRTISAWPADIVWEDGVEPEFNGSPNTTELVQLQWIEDLAQWFGRHTATLNASGGSTLVSLELDRNESNVDVFARVGSPAGPVTLTLRIAQGVVISSTTPGTPALSLDGFAATSIINIINNGYIQGCGGDGGNGGGSGGFSGNDPYGEKGRDGFDGGDAILGPSSACDVNITNGNGFMWGGGGGGGGGGGTSSTNAHNLAAGGGGGGGAGGGRGGQGMHFQSDVTSGTAANGTNGVTGTTGPNGTFGAKGTGGSLSAATGGDGGNGGDWGTSGDPGDSPTAQAMDVPGGNGGGAGKAYNQNGGSAVSFVSGGTAPHVKGATV